eukprot:g1265.t1
MDSKKIKWFDASDALLVVRIIKAKHLKNKSNLFPESGIKSYVIVKYADFEISTSKYSQENGNHADAAATSWKNPHWGDALSDKENVFVCPYKFNTNLSLIVMQEIKGKRLPYAHTFVKFPSYPDANPPKMNHIIKFSRELTPIARGSELERSLRKEVYTFNEACRELEKSPMPVQSLEPHRGDHGDLVFKICVVSRSTLTNNLRYIEKLYPHVPESLHILIDFERMRLPRSHRWFKTVVCKRSELVKLSKAEIRDALGISKTVDDDDIAYANDDDGDSDALTIGSKVKVVRVENESGEQISSVTHGVICDVHMNGTYSVADLKALDSRFTVWSPSALARGYEHFWDIRDGYFDHQPAIPIGAFRETPEDVVKVKWPAMSFNQISLSHDSSREGWTKKWPLSLIVKSLTRDGRNESVIGVVNLEPEDVVNFIGGVKSITRKLSIIRDKDLLALDRFSSVGSSRTGAKSEKHTWRSSFMAGEIDINVTAFCPAILLDILARNPAELLKKVMKIKDASPPESPASLANDFVPSSPAASVSHSAGSQDLKRRLKDKEDVSKLRAMVNKLKFECAEAKHENMSLRTREQGRGDFFREKIISLEKSKREMETLIDKLKTTLIRKEMEIKTIEGEGDKTLYLAKKTEDLEKKVEEKSSQIDALRELLAKAGGDDDFLSLTSLDEDGTSRARGGPRRGSKARQYSQTRRGGGGRASPTNGGFFSVCCGGRGLA